MPTHPSTTTRRIEARIARTQARIQVLAVEPPNEPPQLRFQRTQNLEFVRGQCRVLTTQLAAHIAAHPSVRHRQDPARARLEKILATAKRKLQVTQDARDRWPEGSRQWHDHDANLHYRRGVVAMVEEDIAALDPQKPTTEI